MERSEAQKLMQILYTFKAGNNSTDTTIREIKRLFKGLRLDTEAIELKCFNCGERVYPFIDEAARIVFDPGFPDGKVSPGEPAAVYLQCEKCMECDVHGR